MRYCKIENNKVVDFIEATDSFIATQEGTYIQDNTAKKGWIYDGTSISEPTPPAKQTPTFTENQVTKIQQVHNKFQSTIDSIKAQSTPYEIETWATQTAEWTAWTANNTASTPFIDALATARGVTRDVLLAKVGTKVLAIATILGQQQALEDAIDVCVTQAELDLITI